MIGDTFHTDIVGANKTKIDSALVLTGNAKALHNHSTNMNEKLSLLYAAASELKAYPNFVIILN